MPAAQHHLMTTSEWRAVKRRAQAHRKNQARMRRSRIARELLARVMGVASPELKYVVIPAPYYQYGVKVFKVANTLDEALATSRKAWGLDVYIVGATDAPAPGTMVNAEKIASYEKVKSL